MQKYFYFITIMLFAMNGLKAQVNQSNSKGRSLNNEEYSRYKMMQGITINQINLIGEDFPNGYLAWDGKDPFKQPIKTLDYYGSGDANNDGFVDDSDIHYINEIIDGLKVENIRADVDGDRMIAIRDIEMIDSLKYGKILPAWWDQLKTREERISWIHKILMIDQTDKHPYVFNEYRAYVCHNFANQLALNNTYYHGDLHQTQYNGGKTIFNIPTYKVDAFYTGGGHSIDAILIGENPLLFSDWLFIEPQNDGIIEIGMWDMPYNSELRFRIFNNGHAPLMLTSKLNTTDWQILDVHDAFILSREQDTCESRYYDFDSWNPRIIYTDKPVLFYERTRDDIYRATDLYYCNNTDDIKNNSFPILKDPLYSRLLDVKILSDGLIHILWKAERNYNLAVYHGIFDPVEKEMSNITRVTPVNSRVKKARLLETSDGVLHVIYYNRIKGAIYWTKYSNYQWSNVFEIAQNMPVQMFIEGLGRKDYSRYFFDSEVIEQNKMILIWAETHDQYSQFTDLKQRIYDNGYWSDVKIIETSNIRGVGLTADHSGKIHLLYWLAKHPNSVELGYGNLVYRNSIDNGITWSDPIVLDDSNSAYCPRLVCGNNNSIYAVWVRSIDNNTHPVFNKYVNGEWTGNQSIEMSGDYESFYPDLTTNSDDDLFITWLSRNKKISLLFYYYEITNISENKYLPVKYSLSQNFPNPFNPCTKINYSIPKRSYVKLKVFNSLGENVKILVEEYKNAGEYIIEFNATNLPSGIYFYKINSDGYSVTKKMVLLK